MLTRRHYKFAFVRNPFDRMVSWWAFHRRQKPWKTVRSFNRYLRNTRLGYRPPAPEAIEITPPGMVLFPLVVAQGLT